MLLTNDVASVVEPHMTVVPLSMPVPLAVSVKGAPPAIADVGETLVKVSDPVTVNVTVGGEVWPAALTVTAAVPGDAIKDAGTAAVSRLLLTNVVASADPFHVTCVPLVNPDPFTVNANAAVPAIALCGEMLEMAIEGVIVKVSAGGRGVVSTVTDAVPVVVIREAGTLPDSVVEEMKDVLSALPFQRIWVPGRKFVPFTVNVNAGPPSTAEFGEIDVNVGAGLIVNVRGAGDGCPACATDTDAVPALATNAAATGADNCVDEINVVGRFVPFQVICAPLLNPVPVTLKLNAPEPAIALCGAMLVSVTAELIVNVRGAGCGTLLSVMAAVPALAISDAGTVADSCPELMKLVGTTVPFHVTCIPDAKFKPFTVSANDGPPAVAELGERKVSTGAGLIVKVTGGGGVCPACVTVTGTVPAAVISEAGTFAVN